jgi:STE24 endopeptidase
MTLSNPWFLTALLAVLGVFHLELIVLVLNLARLGRALPSSIAPLYPEDTLQKLREYLADGARVTVAQDAASLAALLAVWWGGGFGLLHEWATQQGLGTVGTGVLELAAVSLAGMALNLPFEMWDTFGVEARHGFNRTSWGTFWADKLKTLLLMALLGLPLAWVLVTFFEHQRLAALWAWLFIAAFSLLMTFLSPRLLMPLFLKFTPLPEGELRQAILDLAHRLDFPVGEVSVVDGSRRSSKANAFFAGFGRARRIALFDTLLEKHSQQELQAVLAHEIGHSKLRHVWKHLALGLLELGFMLCLLAWTLQEPGFFAAFGIPGTPVGMGLVLFSILYRPVGMLTGLAGLALSRKHEYEADAYAVRAMGSVAPLKEALRKL